MSSSTILRGALIGCGNVSRHHLNGWARIPGVQIAALCETDPGRLSAAAAQAPGASLHQEASALFDSRRPLDFVEICTGPASHRELVALAARHGAHVLCQKPAALVREDLLAMIECCESAGVRLMIHENWRFRPWNRALHSALDLGAIGRPIRLRIAHADTRALLPEGFDEQPFLARAPRLILMEMGCHLIDTARFLLGDVRTVAAVTARFGEGHPGEDVATLTLAFDCGALGLLDMTWCAPPDLARPEWALNQTVLEGTTGTLSVTTEGNLRFRALQGESRILPVALPPDDQVYLDGYSAAQSHFIEGLRRGLPHETSGRATLKTMDVVWSAYRAAETGATVTV